MGGEAFEDVACEAEKDRLEAENGREATVPGRAESELRPKKETPRISSRRVLLRATLGVREHDGSCS